MRKANELEANELRIGNWVKKMNVWWKLEDMQIPNGKFIDNYIFQPIPITETWLVKFGFEKTENGWFEKIFHTDCDMVTEVEKISINLSSNRCSISFVGYIDAPFKESPSVYTGRTIEYVHQLQNLYFAFTGIELEIKIVEEIKTK